MRVVVPSYTYTLIKISALKTLNIKPHEYRNLEQIKNLDDLLVSVNRYFPGISKIRDLNVIEIEKALFSIYFNFYEKILISSPQQMQFFLLTLLHRYEIWNIKTYIVGKIAQLSDEEISNEILFEPEKILQRSHFISNLLKNRNLQDGIIYLKKSQYAKVIERGMYYFEKTKEIFLLEALLDKFVYTELLDSLNYYTGIERDLFSSFIDIMIQKYNLILVYRSIRNNIPKDLVKQLILPFGTIFNPKFLMDLLQKKTREEFVDSMKKFTSRMPKLKYLSSKIGNDKPLTPILSDLNHSMLSKLDDFHGRSLDEITIENILKFTISKENEIFKVLALFIKIIHKIVE